MKPEHFETVTRDFTLNGRQFVAKVEISTVYDDCIDFEYLSHGLTPAETTKLGRELDNGNISPMILIVKATCDTIPDLNGNDSLGAVLVRSRSDVTEAVSDHGMIENAIEELIASYSLELDAARVKVRRLESLA